MRWPAYTKTIRFRLTLIYSALLLMLGVLLIGFVNLAVEQSLPDVPQQIPRFADRFPGGEEYEGYVEAMLEEREYVLGQLRRNSYIALVFVLVLGTAGGYFLSGRMLKPVDRVSSLAARISHTNLKERIRHQGPDDEVKRLSDTFDEMLERLEGAFESQKRFVQDASHELRTPMAIAQTNVEVLEMQEHKSVGDYEHLMGVLKMSLERMNSVGENLLLLSAGEQAQSTWSAVDMGSLVDEVAAEAKGRAAEAEVGLEAEIASESVSVMGDVLRLKQAVMNLVDNAIKYNRPGGSVKVSARSEDGLVFVTVQDTGIGISAGDLSRVFDRFYRVDKSRSRNLGGSGLGLSIVKKIIEDHKGTVMVDSVPGEGSTFTIALPSDILK
jgi:signal transduction histidine kinase